jgi:hypothetical protein
LAREQQNRVDVLALGDSVKAIDRHGAKLASNQLSTMGHGLADRANIEAIAQRAQRGPMPYLPGAAESYHANA